MSALPLDGSGFLRNFNRRGNFNLSDPFSGLTPDELRRRMEYERNNPDEFRQTIMPVPRIFGPRPRPMLTDMRARPPISVRPVARPQPFQPQPVQEFNPLQLPVSGDKNTAESSSLRQFGQQPQFNQQGMQQMMQMMQQMMQMISQFSNQGGYGGGMGGGYGSMSGPFEQMMRPMPRPMPRPSYFRPSYFSQSPFGRY